MTMHIAVYGDKSVGKTTFIHAIGLPVNFDNNIAIFPNFLTFNMYTKKRPMRLYEIKDASTLMNQSILFDVIIFLADKFTVDKQLFENIIHKVNQDELMYGKKTNIILCINKCDLVDYELTDNMEIEFINEFKEKYDELKKYIAQFDKTTVTIEHIFSEMTYIIRLLKNDIDIDPKYFEILGESEFGKQKWKKFKPQQRKVQITALTKNCFKKADTYAERIKQYGLANIQKILKKMYDDNEGSRVLEAKLKYIESQINTAMTTIDQIEDFLKFTSIITCDKLQDNNLAKLFDEHIIKLYQGVYNIDNLNNSNIPQYEEVENKLTKLYDTYQAQLSRIEFTKYTNSLTDAMNSIYISMILNSLDSTTVLECIKKLKKNKCTDLSLVISKLLNFNMVVEKWIDDPEILIKYFKQLLEDEILNKASATVAVFNCITDKLNYMIKYKYENTVNIYITYCYLLRDFVRSLSSEKYYDKILLLEATNDYILQNLVENKNPAEYLVGKLLNNRKEVLKLEYYLEYLIISENSKDTQIDDKVEQPEIKTSKKTVDNISNGDSNDEDNEADNTEEDNDPDHDHDNNDENVEIDK